MKGALLFHRGFSIMIFNQSRLLKRTLSTECADIGQVFIKDNVQKLLKDITRFEESKIFATRTVSKLKSPKLMFMTDSQLQHAKAQAYKQVKSRLQMPPVMEADNSKPKVLSRDEEIVGYTKFRIMFVDIGPGYTDRNRLMSVREPDGTLRYPTHAERSRLNHMFFPGDSRSLDEPKLFQEENLMKLLKKQEYSYVLNRACSEFEPDDPRYVKITSTVYNYIDDKGHYDKLRSTRHFGPMSLFLAFNKRADGLMLEMLSKKLVEDAAKLVKIYNTCHNISYENEDDDLVLLRNYSDQHTAKKHHFDLALQNLENKKADASEEDKKED